MSIRTTVRLLCTITLVTLAFEGGYTVDAASLLQKAKQRMNSVGSFAANIQIFQGSNPALTGHMKYQAGKLFVKFNNNKVLATNGEKLWLHDNGKMVTGEQDVTDRSGGLGSFLYNMNGIVMGSDDNGHRLKLKRAGSDKVTILRIDKTGFMRSLQTLNAEGQNELMVKLSNVQIGIGFPTTLFSYHPPANTKTVINPLNYKK